MNWRLFFHQGVFLKTKEAWLVGYGEKEGVDADSLLFSAPDFFLSQSGSWVVPQWKWYSSEELKDELLCFQKELAQERVESFLWTETPSFEQFETLFLKIKDNIKNKHWKKAVPVVFETSKQTPKLQDKLNFLIKNLDCEEHLYPYGFWNDTEGMMGVTPEVLFEQDENFVNTVALAGTRDRLVDENLLLDAKEKKEHEFVVEGIVNKLKNYGEVKVFETKECEFKTLVHLKTEIKLFSDKVLDSQKLLKALHPTPALGGEPSEDTFLWLKKESAERNRFGAPFGFSYKRKSFFLVAIRNIQWSKEKTYLGSGCGVVKESVLEKEWKELASKRQWTKDFLF